MSSHQVKEMNCTQRKRIEKQDDKRVLKPHLEWNSTETKKKMVNSASGWLEQT